MPKFTEMYVEIISNDDDLLIEGIRDILGGLFSTAAIPLINAIKSAVSLDRRTKAKIQSLLASEPFKMGKATEQDFKILIELLGTVKDPDIRKKITAVLLADKNFQATLAMAKRDPKGELRQVLVQLREKPWWLSTV